MSSIEVWIFGLMLMLLPPQYRARVDKVPLAETWADYVETAAALSIVVTEEEPLFRGPYGRAKTAIVLLSLARHESAFRNNSMGDVGRSHCLMAVMTGVKGRVQEGTGEDLRWDKIACFRAGLRIARQSFRACRYGRPEHRLAAYASGSCNRGLKASESRLGAAMALWRDEPLPSNGQWTDGVD
jgi:hypothetical protein